MPTFNITSGLPDLPVGLNDKDASLVGPIYRAVTALAQQLSLLTGNIQYSAAEQAQIDQFSSLIDYREQRIYVKALVTIPYGALITISLDGGKLAASLADATILTQPAHGICDTIGGIPVGEFGVVLFSQGRTSGVAGTVLGGTYYLSTAGAMQLTMPTASGVIVQVVGTGLGSAGFYLSAEQYRSGVAIAISAVSTDTTLAGNGTTGSPLGVVGSNTVSVSTTPYTSTATHGITTLLCDTTATGITVVLPTAAANTAVITIKKTAAANTLTIAATGAQTIDGAATAAWTSQYESITVVSDGTNWMII